MKTLVHFMDCSYILWISRTFYETLDILFGNCRVFHEMFKCFRQTLDIFQKRLLRYTPIFRSTGHEGFFSKSFICFFELVKAPIGKPPPIPLPITNMSGEILYFSKAKKSPVLPKPG